MDLCIIVQFIKKNPARCNNVSKFCYSIFIWSSTCFGQHTAHHQEPKTALAASGLSQYVPDNVHQLHCPTTFHVWKTRGYQCSFRPLMMGGVLPETCWASYKFGIIKFWYIVASYWIFLYELSYMWWELNFLCKFYLPSGCWCLYIKRDIQISV